MPVSTASQLNYARSFRFSRITCTSLISFCSILRFLFFSFFFINKIFINCTINKQNLFFKTRKSGIGLDPRIRILKHTRQTPALNLMDLFCRMLRSFRLKLRIVLDDGSRIYTVTIIQIHILSG